MEYTRTFAFVTRRIEYKHLRCAQNETYCELNLSIFQVLICLYKLNRNSKFKRILNADTHNIRITNADGQAITKIRTAIKKLKMVYQKELWYTIFKFIKATQCLAYEKINYSTNLEYFETSPDSISFKVRISPSTSTE